MPRALCPDCDGTGTMQCDACGKPAPGGLCRECGPLTPTDLDAYCARCGGTGEIEALEGYGPNLQAEARARAYIAWEATVHQYQWEIERSAAIADAVSGPLIAEIERLRVALEQRSEGHDA